MLYFDEIIEDLSPGKVLFDGSIDLPIHWHSNIEVGYYLKGGFKGHIDSIEFDVQDGCLVVINSGQMHYLGSKTVGKNRGISVVANMDYLKALYPNLPSVEFDLSLAPERVDHLKQLMRELYDSTVRYYDGANQTDSNTDACNMEQLCIYGYMNLIYYDLMYYFSREKQVEQKEDSSEKTGIMDIVQYVNDHYTEQLTLQDISETVNMSREHISRLFRKKLGITFKTYVVRLRLDHARRLLKTTDLDILHVALESGFPDTKTMNEKFRQVYQQTAKQYKKQSAS